MILYPAIDLKDGQAVRLTRGDYGKVKVYADNPSEVAAQFKRDGATHMHVVDLDGALNGEPKNFAVIERIVKSTDLFVEVGGGIRDEERVKRYLECGVKRVILGTAALRNPEFLAQMLSRYGGSIAVGVDAKDGKVAVNGWTEVSSTDSFDFCAKLSETGVATVVYTDISKDGVMSGANMDAYKKLSVLKGLNIIASGGITFYRELEELSALNIYGAILGKALYEKLLDLKTALETCAN